MSIQPKRIGASVNVDDLNKIRVNNPAFVEGTASTYIGTGEIVTINGVTASGAYLKVEKAIVGGALQHNLAVVKHELRDFGEVVSWAIVKMNTTGALAGDPVYLSDTVAGAIQLGITAVIVGRVLNVGANGDVLIKL